MDPYRVLGIPPTAKDEEIAAAYRRLARKYHPDLNGGSAEAEAKMKELNAAHEAIRAHREGRGQANAGQNPPPHGTYGSAEEGGYTAWTPYGTYRVYRTYHPVRPIRLFSTLLRFILTLMLISFLFRACALLPFAYMPEGGGSPSVTTANTVPPRGEI